MLKESYSRSFLRSIDDVLSKQVNTLLIEYKDSKLAKAIGKIRMLQKAQNFKKKH